MKYCEKSKEIYFDNEGDTSLYRAEWKAVLSVCEFEVNDESIEYVMTVYWPY